MNLENYEIYQIVNTLAFSIGILFGIVAQKNQFCFSGAIKDYILTKSTKRMACVIVAMITVIIATKMLTHYYYEIDITNSYYFTNNINYFSIIVGGALFGIGMMLADGCSSRQLIKFAQGDSRSLVTLIFVAIFSYATVKGFLHNIILIFTQNIYLLELSNKIQNIQVNIYIVLIILFLFLLLTTRKISRLVFLKDGFIIGFIVSIGWYITGVIGLDSTIRQIRLESFSFTYPIGKTLEFITYYDSKQLSFSISIIFGILIGAFLMSSFNKKYSFGCTSNLKANKLKYNMIGGALMGIGGVTTIGCTIGQGLTGLSTLALSSIISIISILGFGYLTAIYLKKQNQLPMCFTFEWQK
jgi:uncharacterized membrane protein YedE/YeeE